MNERRASRRQSFLAGTYAAAGVTVLVVLFIVQDDPTPLWLWGSLAAVFVVLEFGSVEITDRLYISSSMMVGFSAGVVFGRDSGILAVALMGALSVVHPEDLRQRRWRQPASNFGQLVTSSAAGIAVFSLFLPAEALTASHLPRIAAGAALSAVVYAGINFSLVSFAVRMFYPDQPKSSFAGLAQSFTALAILGAYGGVLGAAYLLVGPVILPLMLVTFMVGHIGFATYSQLREAHEDTIRGFVKAVEALDPYTRGHTERVARFVQMTGERLGFGAETLQRLRWAALIHDVGKVAVPAELLRSPGAPTDDDRARMRRHMQAVEGVLSEVDFLAPMVAVAEGQYRLGGSEDPGVEARILAAADAFDSATSTRSYRAAITQTDAFAKLRADADRYGIEVVDALIGAIEERGEVYGSPDADSAAEVARLVKERAIRA